MTQIYIYAGISFALGFFLSLFIFIINLLRIKKALKSTQGFLESEKLIKERLQKENSRLHQIKEAISSDHDAKIQELKTVIRMMDQDILLLQKSNEETEALLSSTNPMVHSLKLKLIEANNTIARYKAQVVK